MAHLPDQAKQALLTKLKNLPDVNLGLSVRKQFITHEANPNNLVAIAKDDAEHPELRGEAIMNGNFPIGRLEEVLDYLIANPLANKTAYENILRIIASKIAN